jgi:predicted nicotinamide N-methyase
VYVFESSGFLGIGGKVWDSAYVLIDYLRASRELLEGTIVVELGAGTGLTGNQF